MRVMSLLMIAVLMAGCTPSLQYRNGQGFYSEKFAKSQIAPAVSAGKAKNLGRFSVTKGSCGLFSQDATDQTIIIPAIQEGLKQLGGNVAENVVANESGVDVLLGILVIPSVLACANWTVSGEALLVDESVLKP